MLVSKGFSMPDSYMVSATILMCDIMLSTIVPDDWTRESPSVVFLIEQLKKDDIITTQIIIFSLDIVSINLN